MINLEPAVATYNPLLAPANLAVSLKPPVIPTVTNFLIRVMAAEEQRLIIGRTLVQDFIDDPVAAVSAIFSSSSPTNIKHHDHGPPSPRTPMNSKPITTPFTKIILSPAHAPVHIALATSSKRVLPISLFRSGEAGPDDLLESDVRSLLDHSHVKALIERIRLVRSQVALADEAAREVRLAEARAVGNLAANNIAYAASGYSGKNSPATFDGSSSSSSTTTTTSASSSSPIKSIDNTTATNNNEAVNAHETPAGSWEPIPRPMSTKPVLETSSAIPEGKSAFSVSSPNINKSGTSTPTTNATLQEIAAASVRAAFAGIASQSSVLSKINISQQNSNSSTRTGSPAPVDPRVGSILNRSNSNVSSASSNNNSHGSHPGSHGSTSVPTPATSPFQGDMVFTTNASSAAETFLHKVGATRSATGEVSSPNVADPNSFTLMPPALQMPVHVPLLRNGPPLTNSLLQDQLPNLQGQLQAQFQNGMSSPSLNSNGSLASPLDGGNSVNGIQFGMQQLALSQQQRLQLLQQQQQQVARYTTSPSGLNSVEPSIVLTDGVTPQPSFFMNQHNHLMAQVSSPSTQFLQQQSMLRSPSQMSPSVTNNNNPYHSYRLLPGQAIPSGVSGDSYVEEGKIPKGNNQYSSSIYQQFVQTGTGSLVQSPSVPGIGTSPSSSPRQTSPKPPSGGTGSRGRTTQSKNNGTKTLVRTRELWGRKFNQPIVRSIATPGIGAGPRNSVAELKAQRMANLETEVKALQQKLVKQSNELAKLHALQTTLEKRNQKASIDKRSVKGTVLDEKQLEALRKLTRVMVSRGVSMTAGGGPGMGSLVDKPGSSTIDGQPYPTIDDIIPASVVANISPSRGSTSGNLLASRGSALTGAPQTRSNSRSPSRSGVRTANNDVGRIKPMFDDSKPHADPFANLPKVKLTSRSRSTSPRLKNKAPTRTNSPKHGVSRASTPPVRAFSPGLLPQSILYGAPQYGAAYDFEHSPLGEPARLPSGRLRPYVHPGVMLPHIKHPTIKNPTAVRAAAPTSGAVIRHPVNQSQPNTFSSIHQPPTTRGRTPGGTLSNRTTNNNNSNRTTTAANNNNPRSITPYGFRKKPTATTSAGKIRPGAMNSTGNNNSNNNRGRSAARSANKKGAMNPPPRTATRSVSPAPIIPEKIMVDVEVQTDDIPEEEIHIAKDGDTIKLDDNGNNNNEGILSPLDDNLLGGSPPPPEETPADGKRSPRSPSNLSILAGGLIQIPSSGQHSRKAPYRRHHNKHRVTGTPHLEELPPPPSSNYDPNIDRSDSRASIGYSGPALHGGQSESPNLSPPPTAASMNFSRSNRDTTSSPNTPRRKNDAGVGTGAHSTGNSTYREVGPAVAFSFGVGPGGGHITPPGGRRKSTITFTTLAASLETAASGGFRQSRLGGGSSPRFGASSGPSPSLTRAGTPPPGSEDESKISSRSSSARRNNVSAVGFRVKSSSSITNPSEIPETTAISVTLPVLNTVTEVTTGAELETPAGPPPTQIFPLTNNVPMVPVTEEK